MAVATAGTRPHDLTSCQVPKPKNKKSYGQNKECQEADQKSSEKNGEAKEGCKKVKASRRSSRRPTFLAQLNRCAFFVSAKWNSPTLA
jgi:hypothetical protein